MAKVKLYEKFENWYNGGVIWIISDTHFDDVDCKLMSPDWPTPDEQVKLINSFVGKKDTLIHLGDVGNLEYVKQLKGYKVLLTGNHDRGVSNYKKSYEITAENDRNRPLFKDIKTYEDAKETYEEYKAEYPSSNIRIKDNRLFDEVYDGPLFINDKILLSHEPIEIPFGINIHGHCHGSKHVMYENTKRLQLNMAADVVNFKPIRLDELIEGYSVEDIHRQTIDRAAANPLHK